MATHRQAANKTHQRSRPNAGLEDAALTGSAPAARKTSFSDLSPNSIDVRWEKILSLRAAIACGRYNISAESLAEKLMESMHLQVPATL